MVFMKDAFRGEAPQVIERIRKKLLKWYTANKRDLPWRRTSDPYSILVSEVMLQQTQVKTVIPYYMEFLARFPTARHLADADLQEVLKVWEGLGYYARARNLHRAARVIVSDHNGRLPDAPAAIQNLPGVGDYIAAAVLSIAFGQARAVVDGNVKRVLSRLFCMAQPVNVVASHKIFQEVASDLLWKNNPGDFNQAVMEFGALICRPGRPDCLKCPVTGECRAFASNLVADYPKREKRKKVPVQHIAVGVVWRKNKVLITRRKPDGLLGGLWEFPGGKIIAREAPEAACLREIKEETNLVVEVTGHISRIKHAYTHFKIVMDVFGCRHVSGRVRLSGAVDHRWIRIEEIETYPFPKANHKFFKDLFEYAKKNPQPVPPFLVDASRKSV
jgi:A/G-specific adenine glycosylase